MTLSWGLMWYDGDPKKPFMDKVGQAARRYREKYGHWPNTCYVHPNMVETDPVLTPVDGRGSGTTIRVTTAPNILLHHFWLGEAQDASGQPAAQLSLHGLRHEV